MGCARHQSPAPKRIRLPCRRQTQRLSGDVPPGEGRPIVPSLKPLRLKSPTHRGCHSAERRTSSRSIHTEDTAGGHSARHLRPRPVAVRSCRKQHQASGDSNRSFRQAEEVLDDGRRRRYCRIIFAGCHSQPLRIARCGARSNRRPQATVRSPLLKPPPGCLFVRRHVRETDNRIGLRFGSKLGADPTVHHTSNHHPATAVRLSEVDASGDALSAPITVNNSGIDARNGQAYHGRKTTTTNEARPAVLDSCAGEEHRTRRQRRRRITPCVRPRAGAPGRTRVLRPRSEASIARSSMK